MPGQTKRVAREFMGKTLYYDVDPDGRVYWLQIHVQRRRVRNEHLVAEIVAAAAKESDDAAT